MKTQKIETGFIGCGFWARCGGQYAGGYRTQRGAINAAKRKYEKYIAKFSHASWHEGRNTQHTAQDNEQTTNRATNRTEWIKQNSID